MHSAQWINGQYHHSQAGQPSQTSHVTARPMQDTFRNQNIGIPQYSKYRPATAGVSQPQRVDFTPHNGAYSHGQTSHWPASTVPQQAVSSQQASTGGGYYQRELMARNTDMQTGPYTWKWKWKSGNPPLHRNSNCLPQMATQQVFHQNCIQNSSNQTAPNTIQANTMYLLEEFKAIQLQMYVKQSTGRQDTNLAVNVPQHGSVPSASAATSVQHAQMPCAATSLSAITHSKQTVHNQNHSSGYRINGTQHGFSSHTALPTQMSISKPCRTKSITSVSSSGPFLSDMSQKTQNHGREATPSSHCQANPMGYETSRNLLKQNKHPINAAAGTGQHLLNSQMIPGNADNPCQSRTVGSDCLLANNNAVSSTQYNLNPPLPKTFYVTVSEEAQGNGFNVNNLVFRGHKLDNAVPGKTLLGSLTNAASRLQELSERISPPIKKIQSPVASNAEKHNTLAPPVKPTDCSKLASHGHASQKAVAVVQPLSQESNQVPGKQVCSETISHQCNGVATDTFVSHLDKSHTSTAFAKDTIHVMDGSNSLKDQISNQTRAKASLHMDSEPSSGETVTASSASVQHEDINGEMNKSEGPKDANANVATLSSVQIIPWTIDKLTLLIEETSKVHVQTEAFSESKSLGTFWENSINKLVNEGQSGCYYDIMSEVKELCDKHVTSDSVILSQVLQSSWSQLQQSCHVLKDDYVHSEVPYTASWLNINEQLDDIDKEFGFPWSLRYSLGTVESDNQPQLTETVGGIPAQIKMLNEALPQPELETVASDGEKEASGVEDPFTNNTTKADSSDSDYSFHIEVLPPDEAKSVFDQVQSEMLKSDKIDNQSDKFMNGSMEDDFPKMMDVKSNEAKSEKRTESPIQEFCCITRWMEMISGSNNLLLSKCQCMQEPSPKEFTVNSFDDGQKEKPRMIGLDGKLDTTMEDKNKANADESMDNQPLLPTGLDQCTEISKIIDLTEDDDTPHSYTNREPKNISLPSTSSSQSSTVLTELLEEQVENLSTEITKWTSEHEDDSGRSHLTPTDPETLLKFEQGQTHSSLTDGSFEPKHTSADKEDKVSYIMSSSSEDVDLHSPTLKKTPSLDDKRVDVGRKWKRLKDPDTIFPLPKKAKKHKDRVNPDLFSALGGNPIIDDKDFEHIATNVRTVKLALFGSSQTEGALLGWRKNHMSCQGNSCQTSVPPNILSVNVSSRQRSPPETVPVVEYSVKQRIHEDWKKSFLPTKMKRRNKPFAQNCDFSSPSEVRCKKALGRTNTETVPVSFEKKLTRAMRTKHSLSVSRLTHLFKALNPQKEKLKNDVITPKPADHMRSKDETGSHAGTPIQEKIILRFSVLSKTFNFKDGSTGKHENTDSGLSMPDRDTKDKRKMTVERLKGAWDPDPGKKYCPLPPSTQAPDPVKKYCPLPPSTRAPDPVKKYCPLLPSNTTVPETWSVFHEFQKKYKQKMQPSMDITTH